MDVKELDDTLFCLRGRLRRGHKIDTMGCFGSDALDMLRHNAARNVLRL